MSNIIEKGETMELKGSKTEKNLESAFAQESQARNKYTYFADVAKKEGFDNIAESRYLGLTTVDQFLAEMGYVAIQMLIKLINNEPHDGQVHRIPTKLVERSSCRALT